jgi:imidazolonepropionase-like amidohydrolase
MTTLSIVNGLVFDGVSHELVDAAVHVVDGRIAGVGDAQPADRVIDARGRTVLPGLIDAHCHAYGIDLNMLELESRPLSYVALLAARRLEAALSRGFTTVRDPAGGDAGLARAITERVVRAPRYLWTGAALSQTGGHGDARAADSDVCGCAAHAVEVVDGVDPLRRAVRERFRRGAHAIKIMTSGGVVSLTDPIRIPQYSAEEIRHAIDNGVRSIEHGNLLDAETAEAMAAAEAFLVPTLATYEAMERRGAELGMAAISRQKNSEVLEAGRKAVELARGAGVRVGFGTDLMGVLEEEQLQGLRLQVEVDGPLLALRSATSVNAELLRRPDLGRVQEGCAADLLIVDGNPLEQPSVLWGGPEKRTVVQAGVPL